MEYSLSIAPWVSLDRHGSSVEHVRSACYLAGIVYIEKYRNAATLQKPIPIWFVFPKDLHKNEWPRN